MVVVATIAAWPIYRSGSFVLVVGHAALGGRRSPRVATVGLVGGRHGLRRRGARDRARGARRRAGPLVRPRAAARAIGDVLLGAVTGWKDLVTVELPVGSYRNLLVPALVVFLAGTLLALRLAWGRGRRSAPQRWCAWHGVLRSGVRPAGDQRPGARRTVAHSAPLETFVGASALLCSLGWMAWRAQDERRQALRRAADATGVRVPLGRTSSDTRRGLLAGGCWRSPSRRPPSPARSPHRARHARCLLETGPELVLTRATSPSRIPRALRRRHPGRRALPHRPWARRPTGSASRPSRPTTASCTAPSIPSSTADARFTRVPSRLAAEPGHPIAAARDRPLRGIWMPTAGR